MRIVNLYVESISTKQLNHKTTWFWTQLHYEQTYMRAQNLISECIESVKQLHFAVILGPLWNDVSQLFWEVLLLVSLDTNPFQSGSRSLLFSIKVMEGW